MKRRDRLNAFRCYFYWRRSSRRRRKADIRTEVNITGHHETKGSVLPNLLKSSFLSLTGCSIKLKSANNNANEIFFKSFKWTISSEILNIKRHDWPQTHWTCCRSQKHSVYCSSVSDRCQRSGQRSQEGVDVCRSVRSGVIVSWQQSPRGQKAAVLFTGRRKKKTSHHKLVKPLGSNLIRNERLGDRSSC